MLIYFRKTSVLDIHIQEYLLQFSSILKFVSYDVVYIVHSNDSGRWLALIWNKS